MDRNTKTLAIGGAGIAAAVALGLTGASLATADDGTSSPSTSASPAPGDGTTDPNGTTRPPRPPMDEGGTLTADAASRAVTAAEGEVEGGTVVGVRARSDGSYEVMVRTDSGRVDVLVSADFHVTGTEERPAMGPGGPGGPGGRGGHGPMGGDHDGDGPEADDGDTGTGSSDPGDANGTSENTSSPTGSLTTAAV